MGKAINVIRRTQFIIVGYRESTIVYDIKRGYNNVLVIGQIELPTVHRIGELLFVVGWRSGFLLRIINAKQTVHGVLHSLALRIPANKSSAAYDDALICHDPAQGVMRLLRSNTAYCQSLT